jgi:hypothetical protein
MPDADRQAACAALAGKLGEHAEDIARLLTLEQGKPLGVLGSRWELGGAQAWAGFTGSLSMPVKVLQDDNTAAWNCTASRLAWWGRSRLGTSR